MITKNNTFTIKGISKILKRLNEIRKARQNEDGFSLANMMFALAIFSGVSIMSFNIINNSYDNQKAHLVHSDVVVAYGLTTEYVSNYYYYYYYYYYLSYPFVNPEYTKTFNFASDGCDGGPVLVKNLNISASDNICIVITGGVKDGFIVIGIDKTDPTNPYSYEINNKNYDTATSNTSTVNETNTSTVNEPVYITECKTKNPQSSSEFKKCKTVN